MRMRNTPRTDRGTVGAATVGRRVTAAARRPWPVGSRAVADGARHPRVARVAQVVADQCGDRLQDVRVLDLACDHGSFSLALAREGVREVLGIEGREENLRRGREEAEREGLGQVRFVQGDVRDLSRDVHGEFDVVLCLGILYHLDVPDVFTFLANVADVCGSFAVIETQVSLAPKRRVTFEGREHWGRDFDESERTPAASLDNLNAFWLTRASLLNVLADVGFTSVTEVLNPPVSESLLAFRDHVVLVATKGTPVLDADEARRRWPERLPREASPVQGGTAALRNRVRQLRRRRPVWGQ